MSTVVLVTDADHPELTSGDKLYAAALAARGCDVVVERWDDPAWRSRPFDLVVLRSPWDTWQSVEKARAFDGFLDELARLPAGAVQNDPGLLRLGEDKANLGELARTAGVHHPDTVVLGDPREAADVVAERGWADGVVKPRFGGSGWGVELVSSGIEPVQAAGGWIVQEHLPAIVDGEIDLVVVDGAVSHAVRKVPAAGEWRTNWAFGPRWEVAEPPPVAVAAAASVIAALPTTPLYARVDGVVQDDRFVVIEVELISPSLFLTMVPAGADLLAEATLRRLGARA